MEQNSNTHLVILGLLLMIVLNLFILDLKVFSPASVRLSDITTTIEPTAANIKTTPTNFLPTTTPSPTLPPIKTYTTAAQTPRETYIPLGTGSTSKSSWEDITATETVVDPANYGTIKEAYFIASLRNPTQNGSVEAQLYNVTDKHPVWGSHVILNGPKEQTITSSKITLDAGNKLYRVQLKSTLSYQAFLDNAKIRIISE